MKLNLLYFSHELCNWKFLITGLDYCIKVNIRCHRVFERFKSYFVIVFKNFWNDCIIRNSVVFTVLHCALVIIVMLCIVEYCHTSNEIVEYRHNCGREGVFRQNMSMPWWRHRKGILTSDVVQCHPTTVQHVEGTIILEYIHTTWTIWRDFAVQ